MCKTSLMQFLNRKLFKNIAIFIGVLTIFILGIGFGSRYAFHMEMYVHENLLTRNLAILAGCKKEYYKCSKEIQEIIIQENDIAFDAYANLEKEATRPFINSIWQIIWSMMYIIYSDPKNINSSERLREHYDAIGCGTSGQLCQY